MANRKPQLFDRWESPAVAAMLLAWADNLNRCYADAAAFDAARAEACEDSEEAETADPVRDGWIGKDGQP